MPTPLLLLRWHRSAGRHHRLVARFVVVFVVVVIVVVVRVAEDEVAIDRGALVVDHLDVVQQPIHRLGLADLGDQLGHGVVLLVDAPDLLGLLPELHRHAGVLHLDVTVGDLEVLGGGDGPERQVGLDRLLGLRASAFEHLLRALAGGREPRLRVDALHLELPEQVLELLLHLGLHHRLGSVDVDERDERFGELTHHLLPDPTELALGEPIVDRCSPLGDGVELAGVLRDPLVGRLGQLEHLDRGDGHGEVGRLGGALRRGREREDVADAGTGELVVEVVGDPPLTELVRPVLGVEPHDLLAVAGGRDVEGQEVTRLGRTVGVDEGAGLTQLGGLGLAQLVGGGHRRVELDPQPRVARHGDDRPHFALGLELDETVLLPSGDLDLGGGDQIDLVLADRLGQVRRDRVAQRLLACRRDADAGFEHPSGHLAVPEAGKLHLAGDRAERLIDVLVELGLIDLDVQLDFVPLEGFDRRFHRA
jgi:hypothetical protein